MKKLRRERNHDAVIDEFPMHGMLVRMQDRVLLREESVEAPRRVVAERLGTPSLLRSLLRIRIAHGVEELAAPLERRTSELFCSAARVEGLRVSIPGV